MKQRSDLGEQLRIKEGRMKDYQLKLEQMQNKFAEDIRRNM